MYIITAIFLDDNDDKVENFLFYSIKFKNWNPNPQKWVVAWLL